MSPRTVERAEQRRQAAQRDLDRAEPLAERNRRGRYATPPALAEQMLDLARETLGPRGPVRMLDPAVGTGTFFSAAKKVLGRRLASAIGYEIDAPTATAARRLFSDGGLEVRQRDFCMATPDTEVNLVVCNPPYVRHHHLDRAAKQALRARCAEHGFTVDGLAGLYVHFMLLADAWVASGGVSVWIVPAEFLDTRYGRVLRSYLATSGGLLRIHRFDPGGTQFDDALVSSAVVVMRKGAGDGHATLTEGGTLSAPRRVDRVRLATLAEPEPRTGPTLGDLFTVRRGLATGANDFFVLDAAEARRRRLPRRFLQPVLPSPRAVAGDAIGDDTPVRLLLDCTLDRRTVAARHPSLDAYLREGEARGLPDRYLCRHRDPWYAQERRPPAPLLCTYMGRRTGGRAVRFIRNQSGATCTNVYHMLYPRTPMTQERLDELHAALTAVSADLSDAGRSYGGGLVKIEPRELAAVPLPDTLP